MKVKILSSCFACGQHFTEGTIVEVPKPVADALVDCGRGVLFTGSAAPVAAPEPVIETRDPEIESPKRRWRRKDA